MKEKIERKKREIENMMSPAPWAVSADISERSDARPVSKNVENSTEVVQKKRGRPKKIIDTEKPEKEPKKMGRPCIYVTDEQKREWYEKRKQGMKEYYKNNRERLDKLNYQALKKRMKMYSLISKDQEIKKIVEDKGYDEKAMQLCNKQEN